MVEDFDELIDDVIREAQNVASAFEWGTGRATAERALTNARIGLRGCILISRQERDALQARVTTQDAILDRIRNWCAAYPVEVFPEPDWEKAELLLTAGGVSLAAVSAANMRHVVDGITKLLAEADHAAKDA